LRTSAIKYGGALRGKGHRRQKFLLASDAAISGRILDCAAMLGREKLWMTTAGIVLSLYGPQDCAAEETTVVQAVQKSVQVIVR